MNRAPLSIPRLLRRLVPRRPAGDVESELPGNPRRIGRRARLMRVELLERRDVAGAAMTGAMAAGLGYPAIARAASTWVPISATGKGHPAFRPASSAHGRRPLAGTSPQHSGRDRGGPASQMSRRESFGLGHRAAEPGGIGFDSRRGLPGASGASGALPSSGGAISGLPAPTIRMTVPPAADPATTSTALAASDGSSPTSSASHATFFAAMNPPVKSAPALPLRAPSAASPPAPAPVARRCLRPSPRPPWPSRPAPSRPVPPAGVRAALVPAASPGNPIVITGPDAATLSGWNVIDDGGTTPGRGSVVSTLGGIVLTEGNSFDVGLERDLTIPENPSTLTFRYDQLGFDTTDPSHIKDAFEVGLVDAANRPLVPTIGSDRNVFFNITEGLAAETGSATTATASGSGAATVVTDISNVAPGPARLVIRLVNNDTDTKSTVRIPSSAPPVVAANLADDTAPMGPGTDGYRHDGITTDPALSGTVATADGLATLRAVVDGGAAQDITSTVSAGAFRWVPSGLAPGPHHVDVTATGADGQAAAAGVDFTLDSAPVAVAGGPYAIAEGQSATLDGSGSHNAQAPLFSYQWAFADGTTTAGPRTSRHYADNTTDAATLTVQDVAGAVGSALASVVVRNLPPVVATISPASIPTGTAFDLRTTFADAGVLDTHTAAIDWGDGTAGAGTVVEAGGSGSIRGQHTYTRPGSFRVTVTATDKDGGAGSTAFGITATATPRPAPGASPPVGGTVDPGLYVVPGRPGQTTVVTFRLRLKAAAYRNAGGVYEVQDGGGQVDGIAPGQAGYALAAMGEAGRFLLFPQGTRVGTTRRLTLPAGTILGMFLAQNSSLARLERRNPADALNHRDHLWFSTALANPDGRVHDKITPLPGGRTRVATEDLTRGGDKDFNDQVMTISAGAAIADASGSPGTKFYVADASGRTFRYAASGAETGRSEAQSHASGAARGIASDPRGATLWTIDAVGRVAVSRSDGTPSGAWTARGLGRVEDIALDGTGLDVLDAGRGRVDFFSGAASRRSGTQAAGGGFALASRDASPTGLVTDGTTFWITDASAGGGSVFVYDRAGDLQGSWKLDPADADPRGLTRDPSGGSDLWVVDGDGSVYAYAGGMALRSGSAKASGLFRLDAGDARPEGIADPPIVAAVTLSAPADSGSAVAGSTVLATGHVAGLDPTTGRVTLDGSPVASVDAQGNFFAPVSVAAGRDSLQFVASDATGSSSPVSVAVAGTAAPAGPVDFSLLSDVTPSYKPSYGHTSFDQATQVLYAELSARNVGTYEVRTPLLVGVEHISDPSVVARSPDGTLPDGTPYYNFSSLVAGGISRPGDATGTGTLAFYDPDHAPFRYDLVFLGDLDHPPAFTSAPTVSVPAGKAYAYAATAGDRDGDALAYSLADGPAGMTIDPASGAVSWATTAADAGNHDVTLGVSDGRGGTDRQHFVVTVTSVASNGPPVWTSSPVVDANVGAAYAYPGAAKDPDLDPLTFSVVSGPAGLTIDPSSGSVLWTPTAAQVGLDPVVLSVADDHGHSTLQAYSILVAPTRDSHPPVIVSTPQTTFNLPGPSGTASGTVSPGQIALALAGGATATRSISVTLPRATGAISEADVFLLFDDTGSFADTTPTVIGQFPQVIASLQADFPTVSFGFGVGRFEDYSGTSFPDGEDPQGRPFILNQPVITPSTPGFTTAINAALNRTTPGFGGDTPEADIEALYQAASGRGFDGNGDGTAAESGPSGPVSTQLNPGPSGDVPAFGTFQADPAGPVLSPSGSLGGAGFRAGAPADHPPGHRHRDRLPARPLGGHGHHRGRRGERAPHAVHQ